MDQAASAIRAELIEGGTLLRVVLDRPPGNLLTAALCGEVAAALAAHRELPQLRLVYLVGAGHSFSYGASIQEHRAPAIEPLLRSFHGLARAVAEYPVPVAALVEGRCYGGAFELVLCCHLVFATPGARFAWPEIKLGVFPPLAAALAPLRLGGALAERLILTGDELSARSLERAGFLAALFETPDPELPLVEWYRERMRPLSAEAIRQATRALRSGSELRARLAEPLSRTEAQYLAEAAPSHDGREGIEAFLAKRSPRFEDR
jgi:cyclohexa-1,5-dienecarbonyl-CoA hydratase